ncbi:MAG: polysaccharide biosynthesis C-terminal domain-containing protein [Candidatus Saccharibacteria bacterium]|nr:polysaccharide biosynthesis C-terminal domain-containing protein [Candidatus Saccharibacteria bacterium]
MRKNKVTLRNVVTTLALQIVTIISGFIIPKLILSTFGSETNGLISSLQQFLNYIALVEGGLNGVIMANLYKPLVAKDYKKVSSIIKTSNSFFKKISIVFVCYTIVLAIVYPLLFKTSFSWGFIFTLTLILSIKLFVQYCFSLSLRNLLNADKKVYIVSLTQIALIVADTIIAVAVIKLIPNIHIFKLISAIIFMSQPIIYNYYIKKHYPLEKNVSTDKQLLANRWDGFAINVAYFVHSNTDIAVISIFRGLKEASVYSVYALVVSGIKQLCQALWKALSPSIGKLYASGDQKELNKKFDTFEYITFFVSFFMFGVAATLITPFVQIYTSNITDVNYNQPIFGVLILIAETMYIIREPYTAIAYSANKFKEIRVPAIIEAILNIAISIALVPWLGIIGVAVGTVVAMTYRTLFQVWYLRKHLINRPVRKFMKGFLAFAISTSCICALCIIGLPIREYTIMNWISHAILYSGILLGTHLLVSMLLFRKEIIELKEYIVHRK